MQIQKDYILRIIEQFVAVLMKIISARKFGNHEEAIQLIQEASMRYLKKDLAMLMASTPEQLEAFFNDPKAPIGLTGKQIDVDRCLICAELLFEVTMLLNETEHRSVALSTKTLSLHFYALAFCSDKSLQGDKYRAKISQLIAKVNESELPEITRHILTSYRHRIEQ